MRAEYWGRLFLLLALAFLVNTFIYFSFANVYSSGTLTLKSFENQFHSGIYQYRILSGFLFVHLHDYLVALHLNYDVFKFKFLNKDSEPAMLLTYYILNTAFFLLSTLVFNALLANKNCIATSAEKLLLGALTIFTIGISQFVMVPYDVSSYFFLLLFFYFLLKFLEKEKVILFIALTLVVILSSFNRETAALSLALGATLLYLKYGISRKSVFPMSVFVLAFLSVYVGLRLWNSGFTTNDGNLFLQNFTNPKNILGLAFWFVFFSIAVYLAKSRTSRNAIFIFHLCALPYIVMCFYSGILYEIRLYVPLLLASLLLGQLKFPLAKDQLK